MDISAFKELGIAGIAIGTLGYVCFKLIKLLTQNQTDYKNFVQDNNHTTTELVREATAVMVETKNTIANHNEVSKMMLEEIRKRI